MNPGAIQNNFPAHLTTIIEHLNLPIDQTSDVQDKCFSAVWEHCEMGRWDIITALKNSITQLVNSLGQSILAYCIVEAAIEETDNIKAVRQKPIDIFKFLINHKIALISPNQEGNLPIHIAAEWGLEQHVKELFKHNLLDARNLNGFTPLHLYQNLIGF